MCFGDGYSGGVFRAYPFGDLAASSPLAAKCILYTSVYYLAAWTRNPSPPKVSVLTLISLFRILRARLPSHHLPTLISDHLSTNCWLLVWCFSQGCCMLIKINFNVTIPRNARRNLRRLVDVSEGDSKNHPRVFWGWLRQQPWRKMLPEPVEYFGCFLLFWTVVHFYWYCRHVFVGWHVDCAP